MSAAVVSERSGGIRRGGRRRWRNRPRTGGFASWVSPQVAALIAVLMVTVVGSSAVTAPARAGGSEGPTCVKFVIYFSSVGANTNSTNVTLSWSISHSASVTLAWGSSTQYGFTALTNQQETSGGSTVIDFLTPSSTYDFKLTAASTCGSTGGYTGSWTTGSDSMTSVQGAVEDVNNVAAPAGFYVGVACYHQPSRDGLNWSSYGSTAGSGGHYSISVELGFPWDEPACAGGYVVQAIDLSLSCYPQSCNGHAYSATWSNRWNETIDVNSPQVVNFHLGKTTTTWVRTVAEYVHTQNSTITVSQSQSYSSSLTTFVGVGLVTSISTIAGGGISTAKEGQSLEVELLMNTTGQVALDTLTNRTPWVQGVNYWGIPWSTNQASTLWPDPVPLSHFSRTNCDPGGNGWDYQLGAGNSHTFPFTATSTVTTQDGFVISPTVGVDIPGLGISLGSNLGVSFGLIASTTSTGQTTVSATIYNPSTAAHSFDVCEDGSQTTGSEGIVLHVFQTS